MKNKVSSVVSKKYLNTDKYVNVETGETLSSESFDNVIITQRKSSFVINDDNYVTFSREAINYLATHLSKENMSRVMVMGDMLKTDCSILFNKTCPHTSETLSITLNMEKSKFYKMIKLLVKKNILSYCVCSPSGYVQKIYMLNPFIARKRKSFSCELITFFRDVTKDEEIIE